MPAKSNQGGIETGIVTANEVRETLAKSNQGGIETASRVPESVCVFPRQNRTKVGLKLVHVDAVFRLRRGKIEPRWD